MEEFPKKRIENPRSPESEDDERLKAFMEMHPENFKDKERRECTEEDISKMEWMIKYFKEKISLDELNAITHLDYRDAPNHPLRESARKSLVTISKQLKILKEETDISQDKLNELMIKKEELSRAVGIINDKGEVDHTRGF